MVELIVVLVILAIVAAMVIPALLGYTDKAREKKYIANAEMALKATESRLGEIFNDCDNRFSPQMREETRKTAQAANTTAFTVWTEKSLLDENITINGTIIPATKAINDEIGSYTISKALYKENNETYVAYDGKTWKAFYGEYAKESALAYLEVTGKLNKDNNIIYVWPYNGTDDSGEAVYPDYAYQPEGGSVIETDGLTIHLVAARGFKIITSDLEGNETATNRLTFTVSRSNTGEMNLMRFVMDAGYLTPDSSNIKWYYATGDNDISVIGDESKYSSISTFVAQPGSKKGKIFSYSFFANVLLAADSPVVSDEVTLIAALSPEILTSKAVFGAYDENTFQISPKAGAPLKDGHPYVTFSCEKPAALEYQKAILAYRNGEIAEMPEFTAWTSNWSEVFDSDIRNNYTIKGAYNYMGGWSLREGSSYERNLDSSIARYNGEAEIASTIFSARNMGSEWLYFDGYLTLHKNIYLMCDEEGVSSFTDTDENYKLVTVSEVEMTGIITVEGWSDTDHIRKCTIDIPSGYVFERWNRVEGLDNRTPIVEYDKEGKVIEYNSRTFFIQHLRETAGNDFYFEAVVREGRKAIFKGGDEKNSGSFKAALYRISGNNKGRLKTFDHVDYDEARAVLGSGLDEIIDPTTGNLRIKVTDTRTINGWTIYVVYDGKTSGYEEPILAYAKTIDGYVYSNWFSKEPHPLLYESGNSNFTYLFQDFTSLDFSNMRYDLWDTSMVTKTDYMFSNCTGLTSFNINGWDMSKLTRAYKMFEGCTDLESVNFASTSFPELTTIEYIFDKCYKLDEANFSNAKMPKITSFKDMFVRCWNMTGTRLSFQGFEAPNITTMQSMFRKCFSLTDTSFLKDLDYTHVTTMRQMFDRCSSLERIDFSGNNNAIREFGALTNMEQMFIDCNSLKEVNFDYTHFGSLTNNSNFKNIFYVENNNTDNDRPEGFSYTSAPIEKISVRYCVMDAEMDTPPAKFFDVRNTQTEFEIDAEGWELPNCKNLTNLFQNRTSKSNKNNGNLVRVNLKNAKFPKAKVISAIFGDCQSLEYVDLSGADLSSATKIDNMFVRCVMLTGEGDIILDGTIFGLDENGEQIIIEANSLCKGCTGLKNTNFLSVFDFANVSTLNQAFNGCSNLTNADLSSLHLKNCTNVEYMFNGCTNLTTVYVNGEWDIDFYSRVNSITGPNMFTNCKKIVGGEGSKYKDGKVINARIDQGTDAKGYLTIKVESSGD